MLKQHDHEIRVDAERARIVCGYCRQRLTATKLMEILGSWYGMGRHDDMTEHMRRLRDIVLVLKERIGRGEKIEGVRTLEEAEQEYGWKGEKK